MKLSAIILTLFSLTASLFAELKVATLHPVLTDLAKQVGGDKVKVIALIDNNTSPHSFNPTVKDLQRASGAKLFLAAGKGMESYLGKLKANLAGRAEIVEVGRTIPSIKLSKDSALFACPQHHHASGIDPHWWNSPKNIKRATTVIYKHFAKVDPANKAYYQAREKAYRAKIDGLHQWITKELRAIPSNQRYLATAHTAFSYFCKDYGWKALPLHGLAPSHSVNPKQLAETIKTIKEKKVQAVFPEKRANPKALQPIVKATGVRVGKTLIADGDDNVIAMFQNNVRNIVAGITGK